MEVRAPKIGEMLQASAKWLSRGVQRLSDTLFFKPRINWSTKSKRRQNVSKPHTFRSKTSTLHKLLTNRDDTTQHPETQQPAPTIGQNENTYSIYTVEERPQRNITEAGMGGPSTAPTRTEPIQPGGTLLDKTAPTESRPRLLV